MHCQQGLSVTLNAIDEDYKATGKCNLALARKPESVPGSLAWALPKKSPYTSSFTKGFGLDLIISMKDQ